MNNIYIYNIYVYIETGTTPTPTDSHPGSHGRRGSLLLSAQTPNDSFPNDKHRIRQPL